ncbi:MAG: TolC family protein [Lentimicrobiaceae bacterium]|nr:TolC family protein [Lentimicrobiaceae bacterium]
MKVKTAHLAALFLLLVLLLSHNKIFSQQVFSLEQCIDYAIDNNIQLKQQLLQIRNSEYDITSSKLNFLPTVNAGAFHGYNWGQTVDRYTNSFATNRVQTDNFYLSSSLVIFNGLNRANRYKQSKIELNAQKYDLQKAEEEISVLVASAYLQILFATENLNILTTSNESTLLQTQRIKTLVDAGSATKGELYDIESQLAKENSQIVDAKNSLDLAYLSLMQLLNMPYDTNFRVEVPQIDLNKLSSENLLNAESIYLYAVQNKPEIKASELRVQSSKMQYKQAYGMLLPTLSIEGSIGSGYSGAAMENTTPNNLMERQIGYFYTSPTTINPVFTLVPEGNYKTIPFGQQIQDNINKSVRISLAIPIFNGFNTQTSVKKAKINQLNAEYMLENEKLNLQKRIQQAHFDAQSAWNKYQAAVLSEKSAQEAYKYASERFDLKMIKTTDYNISKNNLQNSEAELIKAKYDYVFKTLILQYFMGKPLKIL